MAIDLKMLTAERESGDTDLRKRVIDALRRIFDPEIPLNIYDLGLVYDLTIDEPAGAVQIKMTLTTPACPVAQSFPCTVECAVREVPGVQAVSVELVWDPPWSRDSMSEVAKLELGLL